ncbi:MAG: hypothetical protein D5R96_03350 [Methanocalculus sp. MSAO_Arc2]|nr:MAG: hypothetical protein D5R96_03350 [Methanocalculus sp. MSAO_Arc2]
MTDDPVADAATVQGIATNKSIRMRDQGIHPYFMREPPYTHADGIIILNNISHMKNIERYHLLHMML